MSQPSPYIDQQTTIQRPAAPNETASTPRLNLIATLTQLASRKWLIVKVTAAVSLVGLLLCFVLPLRYTSLTKLMPPRQTQSEAALMMSQLMGGAQGSLVAAAGSGLGLKDPNDIYVGLLKSRPIADGIIQQFNLMAVYHSADMTAARKKLADRTIVESEKGSGFITVSVTDNNKKRAADIANSYTERLRVLTKGLATTEAAQRRSFYEDQLRDARESLITAEATFQQVQQQRGMVQLDAQAKSMIEGLGVLHAQIDSKETELQALRTFSTEDNPEVKIAERQLASLKGETAQLEQKGHSTGFSELGLSDVPKAGLEYLRAQHELQYRQTLFDFLLKQYDAAKLDEGKEAAIIQVIEPAIEPDRKSSPQRVALLVQFLIGGFFLGCFLALLPWWRELLKSNPERASELTSLKHAFSKDA